MAARSSAISYGALERILRSGREVTNPVLQIVESKRVKDGRFRVQLWDARERHNYCMISKQASETIERDIEPRCLLGIKSFNLDRFDDKVVITVTACEVVATASEVGGDLVRPNTALKRGATGGMSSFNSTPAKLIRPTQQVSPLSATLQFRPIASLEPHQDRCFIRARVSSKGDIIPWQNETNGGTLFSFEVFDRSGEISVTAFNLQCQSYFPMIERGKVYMISGFQCNPVDEKWRTNDHPYCLTLGMYSSVDLLDEPCYDIPEMNYDFVPLSGIENLPADRRVDICAILRSVGPPQKLNRRSDGKPLLKRDVFIVDDSKKTVKLTVWHGAVERLNRTDNPVLLIQRARVQDYNGQISVSTRCLIDIDPDIGLARRLKAWWATGGRDEHFEAIGTQDETLESDPDYVDFHVMTKLGENSSMFSEKALRPWNRATISWINRDMAAYKACSRSNCSKKLVEQSDGSFLCEKCSSTSGDFEWRFLLDMILCDATGELRCTAFNQEAERILGVNAKTFGEYIESDPYKMDEVFSAAVFKTFHFKFRGRDNLFRGERRFQFTVAEVLEVAPVQDCQHLVDDIRLLEEFL